MRGDILPPKRPEWRPTRPAVRLDTPTPQPSSTEGLPAQERGTQPIQPVLPTPVAPEPTEQANELPVKKNPSRKRPILLLAAGLAVLAIVVAVCGFIWYHQQLAAVEPGSDEKVKVTIEPGTDPVGIAATLKKSDLIRSEAAFGWYVRLQGKAGSLQSGSYRLSKGDDVPTLIKHLTSGNTDTFSITFLPGATLSKHRQALIDAGYERAQVDAALNREYDHPLFAGKPQGSDLEGYIYGETYNFPAAATPEDILVRTFDEYQAVLDKEQLASAYAKRGFSLYQGITLASIIQREVATPTDAAQVAQVFELRLKNDINLGSDVTYQYIADKTGQPRSIDIDSPYNTRRYKGLPPGPIASPGIDALKAVGAPAAGDYLYFLSGDDDKTYFARTNAEHEKNIREHCQKKCQII